MKNISEQLRVFEHPGFLCKTIREMRMCGGLVSVLELKQLTTRCGVTPRMLQYFEQGERILGGDAFRLYIHALGLSHQDTVRFHQMYQSYQSREALETDLAFYNFHIIAEHPHLQKIVRQLARTRYPALIIDELGFCHVLNTQLMELMKLHQSAFSNPYIWHTMNAYFDEASPVRKVFTTTQTMFIPCAVHLFHQRLAKYFFTRQSLALQQRLLKLSPDEYERYWFAHLMCVEPPLSKTPLCKLHYQGQFTEWHVRQSRTMKARLVHGPVLAYHLLEWIPVDSCTNMLCQGILAPIRPELIFAREFGLNEYVF